ncbi:branched-chain amino acid aminotransferase II [Epithele typhae]|uniref:branched-chain amino acid aminotransferase II n=1 Tax=Epithele typhae TaxID=378194 RepID=UPI00200768FD|nr:branched-chain amino acid aminotransferase II [Epithele typhae]KAH9916249.1 branched-chain amino acid aminotransferase II [Epithele typhae]
MAITQITSDTIESVLPAPLTVPVPAELDASKLEIDLASELKAVPPASELTFGQVMTDHMMIAHYDPVNGWSAPQIKPYGSLSVDPASSCLQYATNAFEGMKAYLGPDGKPRLFRPQMNMQRMETSGGRLALPPFDTNELLKLIKKLVLIEQRWIPTVPGHSLYLRPTIIGTRSSLGVAASDRATLYVICSPTGPFFRTGPKPIALFAVGEHVRSWPGGTGGYKLSLNYASTFRPQQVAAKLGYDQCLWLLNGTIAEAGAMNVFVVLKRDDGALEVATPPLDGTILPGVTRASILELVAAHPSKTTLPGLDPSIVLHPAERTMTMADLTEWSEEGRLLEVFAVGTAAVVAAVGRIGYEGKDIVLPAHEGALGPVARGMYDRVTAIQDGRFDWQDWCVKCE